MEKVATPAGGAFDQVDVCDRDDQGCMQYLLKKWHLYRYVVQYSLHSTGSIKSYSTVRLWYVV